MPGTLFAATEAAPPAARGSHAGPAYARRRPEQTTLHRVFRENLATFYAAAEAGWDGTPLPRFVRHELDGFVGCGALNRGFAHLKCEGCSASRLVAFSCHGRGFCPSCMGRRMASVTANLLDHVLPPSGGQGGAVTVIQRCSSDLRLNPHVHAVFLDGVFVPDAAGGRPAFHALPCLSDTAVADVLQIARSRIIKFLARRGVVDVDDDLVTVSDDLATRDPALAALAAAAVSGLPPAGPARRKPMLVALHGGGGGRAEPTIKSPLCVDHAGFGLHAATTARGDDARGREALVKYVLRPPVASERIQMTPDGLVRLLLKKPFRDGTAAIEMPPLALLARLAVAVPPPRRHVVGYHGVRPRPRSCARSWYRRWCRRRPRRPDRRCRQEPPPARCSRRRTSRRPRPRPRTGAGTAPSSSSWPAPLATTSPPAPAAAAACGWSAWSRTSRKRSGNGVVWVGAVLA